MGNIGKFYLTSILLCIIFPAAFSGSAKVTVVIDGYTVNSTESSPASLPLGTALVLVCRVSGIPQRQIKYSWICPEGPCERPGYAGRKVVNGNILAVNITSDSDGGKYTCEVSRDETDGGYSQYYFLNVLGGHVMHSYGRLVHREHVITRGDHLLPPGDVTGPGRMDCIRTTPELETARFEFDSLKPPNNLVNQSDEDGDQMDTLLFNRSYLLMNNFKNVEGFCRGAYYRGNFFYLFLSPGTLPNVPIVSAEPSTTGTSIEINIAIPTGIRRTIVGYERRDLGVTLQGEYTNIFKRTQHTFSSLVPGARYTVVVQGVSGLAGDRSQNVTREDVKTTETEPSVPRGPHIIGVNRNGIELNWIPPLEPNGDVYYLIEYNDGKRTLSVNTSSESTYFKLTGLKRGMTYNITVVAVNSAGRSDAGPVLKYTHNPPINTPSQKSTTSQKYNTRSQTSPTSSQKSLTPSQKCPTLSQNSPTAVIIVVAVAIIVILLVIITILSVLLILKRKKQPPTEQCDKENMSHIYDVVDDIVKTNQDYQERNLSKMDDKVKTIKGNLGLDARKRDDDVIRKEHYKEIDTDKVDRTTQYASLK